MTIPVGGEIGEEIHHVDQNLVFTSGTAKAIVGGEEKEIKAADLVIVPQGTKHNCERISAPTMKNETNHHCQSSIQALPLFVFLLYMLRQSMPRQLSTEQRRKGMSWKKRAKTSLQNGQLGSR